MPENALSDLKDHACIGFRFSSGSYRWEFEKGRKALTVNPQGPAISMCCTCTTLIDSIATAIPSVISAVGWILIWGLIRVAPAKSGCLRRANSQLRVHWRRGRKRPVATRMTATTICRHPKWGRFCTAFSTGSGYCRYSLSSNRAPWGHANQLPQSTSRIRSWLHQRVERALIADQCVNRGRVQCLRCA